MVRRRVTPPADDPTSAAINRLSQRIVEDKDQQNERTDKIVNRLYERFDRLEAKVDLKIDQLDRDTQRELSEARRDVGELRDLVHSQRDRLDDIERDKARQLEASAAGAARGAGQAAAVAAADTAKVAAAQIGKSFWATWSGKTVASAVAFTALVTGAQAVPAVLRWIEKFWAFVAGAK